MSEYVTSIPSTGPARGSEEYLRILERRIKDQRDQIESLTKLREDADNRQDRKRIAKLEGSLGRAMLKIEEQKKAINFLREKLYECGQEPVKRSQPKVHVP